MTYAEEKRRIDAERVKAADDRQRVIIERFKTWLPTQKAELAIVGTVTGGPEFCAGWDAALEHVLAALERGESHAG